jgi:hypothetical protein
MLGAGVKFVVVARVRRKCDDEEIEYGRVVSTWGWERLAGSAQPCPLRGDQMKRETV